MSIEDEFASYLDEAMHDPEFAAAYHAANIEDQGPYPMAEPNYAMPPGESIKDELTDHHWTVAQFAYHMSMSIKNARLLLEGELPLTIQIAERLERALGFSVDHWMQLERDYRAAIENGKTKWNDQAQ